MKFGGLSEKEVNEISHLLKQEGIDFQIDQDEEIQEFNSLSMKNNLRHYSPPNISTHILSITILDDAFSRISDEGKEQLLNYGITDVIPSTEDFQPFTGESIHKELVHGPKRLVAFNFKHQLIAGGIFIIIYFVMKVFSR